MSNRNLSSGRWRSSVSLRSSGRFARVVASLECLRRPAYAAGSRQRAAGPKRFALQRAEVVRLLDFSQNQRRGAGGERKAPALKAQNNTQQTKDRQIHLSAGLFIYQRVDLVC